MNRTEEDEPMVDGDPLPEEEIDAFRALIRRVRGDIGYWDRYKDSPKPRYGNVPELGKSSEEE